jgi:hypothetical protein
MVTKYTYEVRGKEALPLSVGPLVLSAILLTTVLVASTTHLRHAKRRHLGVAAGGTVMGQLLELKLSLSEVCCRGRQAGLESMAAVYRCESASV